MNVSDVLLSSGQDVAKAILYKDSVVTYGELRDKVKRLAAGLLARGHVKGERIGIISENGAFFIVSYLATIRAGLVAVPCPAEMSPGDLGKVAANADLHEIFASTRSLTRLRPGVEKLGLRFLPEPELEGFFGDPGAIMPEIEPQSDLATLMFTSGSTGEPKGVMVSHRNIECNTRDIQAYLGLTPEDRAMVVLPFHYCFGASLLHTHLLAGASVALNNDFRLYPETVLQEMQLKDCTGLAGVPSTYQILLRKSRLLQMKFPKLRWLQQAGGKLPDACIREIVQAFPTVRFFIMYGQTEGTARLSYLPPERLADKLGSIGAGLPSTRLELVRADGTVIAPGSNESGEIVASGDNIALGYWNDAEETARYFQKDKLHTGDIGRLDADGFIFIVEREREMIKSGGNRVSAKEVESVIAEMGEVVEVAVIGAPHEILGEAIKAFVVPSHGNGISAEAIREHCHGRLPAFKVPDEVILLEAMPHNTSGKVAKARLREIVREGHSLDPIVA